MDFGWHLPCYGSLATRENLILVAREAEACGLESVFVSDHIALPFEPATPYGESRTGTFPVPPTDAFLEPLTALALVAAVTERVKLGTTVLVLPHRHPVLAAKIIATGGLALAFEKEFPFVDAFDPHLTLHGLRLIFERNRPA